MVAEQVEVDIDIDTHVVLYILTVMYDVFSHNQDSSVLPKNCCNRLLLQEAYIATSTF